MPRLIGISSESSTAAAAALEAALAAEAAAAAALALSPESPLLSVLEAMLAALRWERSCGRAALASPEPADEGAASGGRFNSIKINLRGILVNYFDDFYERAA